MILSFHNKSNNISVTKQETSSNTTTEVYIRVNSNIASISISSNSQVFLTANDGSPSPAAVDKEDDLVDDDDVSTKAATRTIDVNVDSSNTTSTIDASIIVHLSGEMGNQLHHLVHGYGIHLFAKETYGLHTNIVLKHQDNNKWTKARDSVIQCFSKFRSYDFTLGNSEEFIQRIQQQRQNSDFSNIPVNDTFLDESFNNECATSHHHHNSTSLLSQMKSGLQYLQHLSKTMHSNSLIEEEYKLVQATDPATVHSNDYTTSIAPAPEATSTNVNNTVNIRLPYVNSTCMSPYMLLDRYYDKIRNDWLYFDKESCCTNDDDDLLPQPDETVFVSKNATIRGAYIVCEFYSLLISSSVSP